MKLEKGQLVLAYSPKFKGLYAATIESVKRDGSRVTVRYDDDNAEEEIPAENVQERPTRGRVKSIVTDEETVPVNFRMPESIHAALQSLVEGEPNPLHPDRPNSQSAMICGLIRDRASAGAAR